jgi:hypothetical protein
LDRQERERGGRSYMQLNMRILILILLLIQLKSSFAQEKSFFEKEMAQDDSICSISLNLKYDSIKERFGFVDKNGKYIIEPQYRCATEFIECIALVSKRDKVYDPNNETTNDWLYINKRNEIVIAPRLENRLKWENNIKSCP